MWEYGEKTWDKASQGLCWSRSKFEEFAPGYIDYVKVTAEPYVELSRDMWLVVCNTADTVQEKYFPYVKEYVSCFFF